jgi:hypothetical protein
MKKRMRSSRLMNNVFSRGNTQWDIDEFCVKRAMEMTSVYNDRFSDHPDVIDAFIVSVNRYLIEKIVEYPILEEEVNGTPISYECVTAFGAFLVAIGEDVDWVRDLTKNEIAFLDEAAEG